MRPRKCKTRRINKLQDELNQLRQELSYVRTNNEYVQRGHAMQMQCCRCKPDVVQLQMNYIGYLEGQLRKLHKNYQEKIRNVKTSADVLEAELQHMQACLQHIIKKVKSADQLHDVVAELRDRIGQRDSVIDQYNAKYDNIYSLIKKLQGTGATKRTIVAAAVGDPEQGSGKQTSNSFSCLSAALRNKAQLEKNLA